MPRKNIGVELRSLNNKIGRTIENYLHKKSVEQITGTNGWIIAYLAERGSVDVYQKDLEKEFGITRSTASKVINLMVKKGMIERRKVEQDARLNKLVLTGRAEEIAELIKEDGERLNEMLTDGFTEEEIDNLYSYIQKMKNNLESAARQLEAESRKS